MRPTSMKPIALLAALLFVASACSDDNGSDNNNSSTDATVFDGGADAGDTGPGQDGVDDTGDDAGDTETPDDVGDDVENDGSSPSGEVVVCDNSFEAPPAERACSTTSGASNLVMLQGDVLAGETVYEDGQVLIDRTDENAKITCVGCDCASEPDANTATVVSCADSVISPGLINAHEHLGWGARAPKPHGDERFEHRNDWRRGKRGHSEISSGGSDYSSEAQLFGELRHMLGGATSIAGSGGAGGFLRNLDQASNNGGVDADVEYETFPLGDTDGTLIASGCGYEDVASTSVLDSNEIFLPHISEGIDAEAENEFSCLSANTGGGNDIIADNTSVIHGIGLTAQDIAEFAASGSQLVWSPRTNIDLYGNTADVVTYDAYGATIALGTDWILSGSMNMLRELQCADYLNQNHYNQHFSDQQIWQMATRNGAIALGTGDELGTIAQGYVADISIFDASDADGYRAVIDAGVGQVQLVMRGGQAVVGEPNIVDALVPAGELDQCESVSICDGDRLICAQRDTGVSWTTILATDADYDPFYCDTPPSEPSCVPSRPSEYDGMSSPDDQDGDGIANEDDVCPAIFDPARPLDDGSQPDFDGDGLGDACDICPVDSGETCDPFDPDDRDGDGTDNAADNCPATANPDQADADDDATGDACDRCPDFANPDHSGCPATIYDVWSGDAAVGDKVLIADAVVTAVNQPAGEDPQAVFIQYTSDASDYVDSAHSGIYVYMPDASSFPARGDNVDISATVSEFGGSKQLDGVDSLTINSSGNPLPAPVTVDPADIATGQPDADTYLNVLVRVDNVVVTDANPDGPDEDYQEFAVDGGLRVDDLLYTITPDPQTDDGFDALVGPVVFSYGNTKLNPRDSADVILGPPALVEFGPASTTLDAGATGVPQPGLAVTLNHGASQPTTVELSYSDTSIIDGPASVDVPANQRSVDVSLTAGSSAAGSQADVTASLGGDSLTATVSVYDDSTPRQLVSLEPQAQTVRLNQDATLTVTLDLPAPAGGQDVSITKTPGISSAPPVVTVPAGQLSTDLTVTAGDTAGTETVTATVGSTSLTADISVTEGPTTPCLIISEYIEGSSYNKGIELYNCDTSDFELSNFGICQANNDGADCDYDSTLPDETLAPGEVYTLCDSQASFANTTCQTTDGTIGHNGNDRYVVYQDDDDSGDYSSAGDTVTDAFGQTAVNDGDLWKDHTYRRCNFEPYYGQSAFDVTDYYTEHPEDAFDDFGQAPTAQSCP